MPTTQSPVVVLVGPQMGENIGMVARAMANMGLSSLRLVAPRDGWPNEKAIAAAAGADAIVTGATLFDAVEAAVADAHHVIATTARQYDQAKPVLGPRAAMGMARRRIEAGHTVAILFGRERIGLLADEIALADAVVTMPVVPEFSSLNLAQAVLLIGYEWRLSEADEGELLPYVTDLGSPPATREEVFGLFAHLEGALRASGFFVPAAKTEVMTRNLRNILHRRDLTAQDVRTLHGVVTSLSRGPRGDSP
jgi:tRNA/rRNA methyltransferase